MQKTRLSEILQRLQISELNAMQQNFIAVADSGSDAVLLADTGSGKTLAYLIPAVNHVDATIKQTQVMIITPSRELALQVEHVAKSMQAGFKITCCYGGHKRETEEKNLVEAPALVIGTPGRLADHLRRGNIDTSHIRLLILDEFDKSLELGFEDEISFIIQSLKALQQRLLISATDMAALPAYLHMDVYKKVSYLAKEKKALLEIKYVLSKDKDKIDTLFRLICTTGNRPSIVFCNHRESVERVFDMLKEKGLVCVYYHGAMEQDEREAALSKFRNGTSNLLITTDLASRGLDIPHIRYIIHYHLPNSEEAFVHRNGRTARMDASGTVILLLGPGEQLPAYVPAADVNQLNVPDTFTIPEKPKWVTLYISAGKKDKVNKIDIVGFLSHKGKLKKEDIGLIEVKDFFAFVAVRRSKANALMPLIKNEKIKQRSVKIQVAR